MPVNHDILPLDAMARALESANMSVSQTADGLVSRQGKVTAHIAISQPEAGGEETGSIRAIVTIKSGLPAELGELLEKPGGLAAFGRYATLGALGLEDGVPVVGSRITLYEGEDALKIQIPLILGAALMSGQYLMESIHRLLAGKEATVPDASAWGRGDFDLVHQYLSGMSVCNADAGGLTAEFGLRRDSMSAITGDHHTALWRLFADQPHPDAGGGILCCLEMPHRAGDEDLLHGALVKLNAMEMAPLDLPPHFGAWCPGTLGDNPAYVSFLPNILHEVPGIAVNFSFWAFNRAQWADTMLPSLGLRA